MRKLEFQARPFFPMVAKDALIIHETDRVRFADPSNMSSQFPCLAKRISPSSATSL
jgi:hypothetical protein